MVARICCLDLDTFFVSVERLFDPKLEGKPVVVGGPRGSRGVVTAASYEVRAYGVHSGMSLRDASRLAPRETIFLSPRHGEYGTYSERVRAVLDRYTPEVRAASIDEFYLDFAGCEGLYRQTRDEDGDVAIERAVRSMCRAIRLETGLPASAGIGASRIIAKVASGRAKPQGVLLVPEGQERAFLLPLPVRKLPGIGPKAESRMIAEGINSLGDLVSLPPGPQRARYARILEVLEGVFAGRLREGFGRERPAFLEHDPDDLCVGSISNERTFFNSLGSDELVYRELLWLVERVCWRARKRGITARTITLKLRYSDFTTIMRSRTVTPTAEEGAVLRAVRDLYHQHRQGGLRVRLLGVALSNLLGQDAEEQLSLPFGHERRVGPLIDLVRTKYGYDSVHFGAAAAKPLDRMNHVRAKR
jgi:DNA polymerase-4